MYSKLAAVQASCIPVRHTTACYVLCVSHRSGTVSQARLLDNQEAAVSGEFRTSSFVAPTLLQLVGDIERGKSTQGCVMLLYTL